MLAPLVILGVGIGTAMPALMTLAMSSARPEDAGLASGLVNTSVQVGGALGLAVLATLSATRTASLRDAGEASAAALTGGYHVAFLVGAALVLAAFLVAIVVLRPARAPAGDGEPAEGARSGEQPVPAYSEA